MVNKEVIARIMTAFLALVETDPDRFDPRDVKMVKEKDWWVERFIEKNRTEDGSLIALTAALDWRKLSEVNDLTEDTFKELLEKVPGMYLTDIKDKEGRPVFWIRIHMYDKGSGRSLRESHKKYITYLMEKQDKITSHEGWVSVTDMSDATMANVDIDFIYYFVKILETYFPRGPKRDIILDLPKTSIINEAAQLVLSYMGQEMKEKTIFITTDELNTYFNEQNIPSYVKQKKT